MPSRLDMAITETPMARRKNNDPPRSHMVGRLHPSGLRITMEVNNYFLNNWPFPDERTKLQFVAEGLPTWHLCQYPTAREDRVGAACRFMVMLFLVDDLLEHLSLKEGSSYNERLISIVKGETAPAQDSPIEKMVLNIWEDMRSIDKKLSDDIEGPTFAFWRSQNDKDRLAKKSVAEYLKYRELDVASAVLLATQRFQDAIYLSEEELASVADLELNYTHHISVINDVMSWDKELRASKDIAAEGSIVSNIVQTLADESGLDYDGAKRICWVMIREWERQHDVMVQQRLQEGCSDALKTYMEGIELQMGGNELWSRTTHRYNAPHLK
ncbi:aristolochene synthase [Colletotrichum fioriniae PJ7]|uniref:Terpene synthase n=2 Tax=Colletotrichum fioriniae TaxID=710243 RepID=A0A010QYQ5_9PEZI|nr:aristolochene synthase [Colletotrichum fioriniae PJ7]